MKEDRKKTVKLLRFDVMNLNNRVYTKEGFMSHLEEMKAKIKKYGCVYGQVGFPDNFDISISKASHKITDIYVENDFVMGEIEILENKNGDTLLSLIESTVFRSRGSGTVDNDTNEVKLKKLFTFDAVDKNTDSYLGLMD